MGGRNEVEKRYALVTNIPTERVFGGAIVVNVSDSGIESICNLRKRQRSATAGGRGKRTSAFNWNAIDILKRRSECRRLSVYRRAIVKVAIRGPANVDENAPRRASSRGIRIGGGCSSMCCITYDRHICALVQVESPAPLSQITVTSSDHLCCYTPLHILEFRVWFEAPASLSIAPAWLQNLEGLYLLFSVRVCGQLMGLSRIMNWTGSCVLVSRYALPRLPTRVQRDHYLIGPQKKIPGPDNAKDSTDLACRTDEAPRPTFPRSTWRVGWVQAPFQNVFQGSLWKLGS